MNLKVMPEGYDVAVLERKEVALSSLAPRTSTLLTPQFIKSFFSID